MGKAINQAHTEWGLVGVNLLGDVLSMLSPLEIEIREKPQVGCVIGPRGLVVVSAQRGTNIISS
jgi:hypothetical protein